MLQCQLGEYVGTDAAVPWTLRLNAPIRAKWKSLNVPYMYVLNAKSPDSFRYEELHMLTTIKGFTNYNIINIC